LAASSADEEQQAEPPQLSHHSPAFAAPALTVASQMQAGQSQASPQPAHAAVDALTAFAALVSFGQQAPPLTSESFAALAAVAGQQAESPQQSQALPVLAARALAFASQVQAGQAQASPQQAHALAAFVFSAAPAPTPITAARAIAPTTPNTRRRIMIRLLI
jgi:hypothetical protein